MWPFLRGNEPTERHLFRPEGIYFLIYKIVKKSGKKRHPTPSRRFTDTRYVRRHDRWKGETRQGHQSRHLALTRWCTATVKSKFLVFLSVLKYIELRNQLSRNVAEWSIQVNIALRKIWLVKRRLCLRNFLIVSCMSKPMSRVHKQQTSAQMAREPNTGRWQIWHFFGENNQTVENYLKFLLTFLNLTELALNEFCGVTVHIHPRGVWRGIFFENKPRPTIKRLGCYTPNPSLDTLLNKNAQ